MQGLSDYVLKTTEQIVIDKLDSIFEDEIQNIERINSIAHNLSWFLYSIIPQNVNNQTFVDFDDPSIHKRVKHNSFQQHFTIFNTNVAFDIHNFDFHSKTDIQYFLESYGQKKLNEWIDFYKNQEGRHIPSEDTLSLCSVLANKNPRREILEKNTKDIIKQFYNKLFLNPIVYYNGDYDEVQLHISDNGNECFAATLLYYSQSNVLNKLKDEWHSIFFETVPTISKELLCSLPLFNALSKIEDCTSNIRHSYNCNCGYYTQKWGFRFITKQDLVELGNKLILLFGKAIIEPYLEFWDVEEDARALSFFSNGGFSPFKFIS